MTLRTRQSVDPRRRAFLQTALSIPFAASALAPIATFASQLDPWERAEWIVKSIKRTSIAKRDFSLADFGARSGGSDKNTKAIAAAIDAAHAAGGGRVVVPAGKWLTGAIHLKSNVELHVTEQA